MPASRLNSDLSSTLSRIDPDTFHDWEGLLGLIHRAFAYMDGLIDPPSSAHRLTPQSLQQKAREEIGYIITHDGELLACAFFRPEPPAFLYVGKLAVAPETQARGLGRALLKQGLSEARALGLSRLRLETRIELVGNHERFARWGFIKTAENAHAGFDRITSIEMQRDV